MEEKKYSNTLEKDPAVVNAAMAHKSHARQVRIIILLAVVCVLLFLVLYLITKKQSTVPERVYTEEEKAALIEDVSARTEEQGLPVKKTQIDIMKYNAQQ